MQVVLTGKNTVIRDREVCSVLAETNLDHAVDFCGRKNVVSVLPFTGEVRHRDNVTSGRSCFKEELTIRAVELTDRHCCAIDFGLDDQNSSLELITRIVWIGIVEDSDTLSDVVIGSG